MISIHGCFCFIPAHASRHYLYGSGDSFCYSLSKLPALYTIHCISGLGADQRIFQKLNVPGARLQAVPWPYFDKHDQMACYAQKVAALIPADPDNIILGLSFGGMLASEIVRSEPSRKAILVSSAKSPSELHPVSKFLEFIGKHRLLPTSLTSLISKQMAERFGAKSAAEISLIRSIINETDPHFASCAIKALMEWKTTTPPPPGIVHIHGTADRILPPDLIKPSYWIEGGEHIMIYNRADEISKLIGKSLL